MRWRLTRPIGAWYGGGMAMDRAALRQVEVSSGSWIDRLPRGQRSAYVRAAVDEHLERVRAAAVALAEAYTDEQSAEMIRASDLPARLARETDAATAPPEHIAACDVLAAECELSGISPEELLAEIGRAHA